MIKTLKRPLPVFLFWSALWLGLFLLGTGLSDFWQYPDRTEYRDFLYLLTFAILPILGCIGIIHFLSCIMTPSIAKYSALVAFFSGFLGVAYLHFLIKQSSDPVAAMAYLASIIFYAVFAIGGFFVSAIGLWLWTLRKAKNS